MFRKSLVVALALCALVALFLTLSSRASAATTPVADATHNIHTGDINPGSCPAKPETTLLTSPANEAWGTGNKVPLDWETVPCAQKYKVTVRQDSTNGITVDQKQVTASKYKTHALAAKHTYYWRVKACNEKGCTASSWSSFKIVEPLAAQKK